jgi:hypothetical protein
MDRHFNRVERNDPSGGIFDLLYGGLRVDLSQPNSSAANAALAFG